MKLIQIIVLCFLSSLAIGQGNKINSLCADGSNIADMITNVTVTGDQLNFVGQNGGFNGSVTLPDENTINTTLDISRSGTQITVTLTDSDGNSVSDTFTDLTGGGGGSDGVVTNVSLSGNDLIFTGVNGGFNGSIDLSSIDTDEQTLSLSGSTLSISNGNSVTLPTGGNDGNGWWSASNNNTVMAVTNTTLGGNTLISGNGTNTMSYNDLSGWFWDADFTNGFHRDGTNAARRDLTTLSTAGDLLAITFNGGSNNLSINHGGSGAEIDFDGTGISINDAGVTGTPATDEVLKINSAGYAYWGADQAGSGTAGNGMFDIANQGGDWDVTSAFLTGNSQITGQNETINFQNITGSGTHRFRTLSTGTQIGTLNGANSHFLNSTNSSIRMNSTQVGFTSEVASAGTFASISSEDVAIHLSGTDNEISIEPNNAGTAQIGDVLVYDNDGGGVRNNVRYYSTKDIFDTLTNVNAATSAAADAAAGTAGVGAGDAYKWDDGNAIHLMIKK